APRVDEEAVAVEDELVLTADQVAEGEVGAVGARPLGEHRFALAPLAAVVRRARRARDQARARRRLALRRRAPRPDVLADRQSDAQAGDLDRRRLLAGDEVTLLVEDGVVGQPVLAVDGAQGAPGEYGERVVGVAIVAAAANGLGEPDQGGEAGRVGREL